jgi:hypothetical protein
VYTCVCVFLTMFYQFVSYSRENALEEQIFPNCGVVNRLFSVSKWLNHA